MAYNRDDNGYDDQSDAYTPRPGQQQAALPSYAALPASDPNSPESLAAINANLGFPNFDPHTGLNADGTTVVGPNGDPSHESVPAPKNSALPTPPPAPGGGGGGPAPVRTIFDNGPAAGPAPTAGPPPTAGTGAIDPNQQRANDLYDYLMGKAKQSEVVDPNDPVIRAQSDTYSANLTRQGRRFLSELAERKGAGGNIGAESRMMSEKNAQAGAAHEGDLLQHELDSRRAEIQNALTTGAQFLTGQQQMALQKELATIDQNMKMYQTNLQDKQFGQNLDLSNRTLTQQGDLARAGFANSAGIAGAGRAQSESEFARNLQQRAYEYDTTNQNSQQQ